MASDRTADFEESMLLDAPADAVYAVIADYHNGHPRIIPNPPFKGLDVLEGGRGAGTVIRVTMKAGGRTQSVRGVVTEPEPGRLLVEAYDSGYVTSFRVEPREDGRQAYVTIATSVPPDSGVLGKLGGWFVARLLRPVYRRELELLQQVALAESPAA